jgi:glycine cleavage system regulatory protein
MSWHAADDLLANAEALALLNPVQKPLVMTIIGRDRPGLVDLLAGVVAEHGGNWLESQMAHLGGQFAGLLRVHVPEANEPALTRALSGLAGQGITVVVHADRETSNAPTAGTTVLELIGQDRPGIVRQISRALAQHGVNVEELRTECASAPMSGETLFKAQARLHIPASCNSAALRRELERIAADLMVDLSLKPVPTAGGPPSATAHR